MSGHAEASERWRRSRPGRFWQRVTEGLTLAELWTRFQREASASYRLYSKELEREPPAESRWRHRARMARALFWAMLAKLSPARRLFLLLALVAVVLGIAAESLLWLVVGTAMLVALLALELADRVAMKRDLEIARDIQRWLLPKEPPEVPGFEIAFATRAANTVAGDYYDAFLRHAAAQAGEPAPVLFAVADVAGKSMPAALLMATFQASLRTVAHEDVTLPELVDRVNRYACEHSLEGRRFTTAVLAEVDAARTTLTYVNAGHNPPLLRRASGEIERLEAGGLPLGIDADARHESRTLPLGRGDLLVIYTDGIVEAENDAREDYGEARLVELVRAAATAGAEAVLERVLASVAAFVGGAPQQDDITCVVVRYRGVEDRPL